MAFRYSNVRFIRFVVVILILLAVLLFPNAVAAKKVAVILAIDNYQSTALPRSLDIGLEQALKIGGALKASDYEVRLVIQDGAIKNNLTHLFSVELPAELTKDDALFFYVDCLAVGGDSDTPYLLPWDTNPDDIESSALAVDGLLSSLVGIPTVVVTRTTRGGSLRDIALIGPMSRHWAEQSQNILALSYLPPKTGQEWSEFGRVVADGLGVSSDTSGDRNVTLAEFRRFVESRVGTATEDRARIDVAGDLDQTMTITTMSASVLVIPVVATPITSDFSGKKHPVIGWSLAGSGAALTATSAILYGVGQSYLKDANPGDKSTYETVRTFQIGTGLAGGVTTAVGAGFLTIRF